MGNTNYYQETVHAFIMYINLLPQMIVLSDWDFDRSVLCWSLIGSKNVL